MATVIRNTLVEGAFDCRTMPYYLDVFPRKEEWLEENRSQTCRCNARPSPSGWRWLMLAIGNLDRQEVFEVGLSQFLGEKLLRRVSEAMLAVNSL